MNKFVFKDWLKATGIRTLKTFCETLCALIGSNAIGILDINWVGYLTTSATAALICVLTCVNGLPELDTVEELDEDELIEEAD